MTHYRRINFPFLTSKKSDEEKEYARLYLPLTEKEERYLIGKTVDNQGNYIGKFYISRRQLDKRPHYNILLNVVRKLNKKYERYEIRRR